MFNVTTSNVPFICRGQATKASKDKGFLGTDTKFSAGSLCEFNVKLINQAALSAKFQLEFLVLVDSS